MLCQLYYLSPLCFVHFADYKLANAKNDEENGSVLTILGQSRPMAGKPRLDRWARIQFGAGTFWRKTLKNQHGTMKNHGNQPKTMKNHETTLKNHGNQPKTMKNPETT